MARRVLGISIGDRTDVAVGTAEDFGAESDFLVKKTLEIRPDE